MILWASEAHHSSILKGKQNSFKTGLFETKIYQVEKLKNNWSLV